MVSYTYNKTIIPDLLQIQIINAGLTSIQYIETVSDDVAIFFSDALSMEQKTLLDALVSAHNASPVAPIKDATPRQIRQALILSGVTMQQIEDALNALSEPSKTMARIEWEYSISFQRNRPFVNAVAAILGWTSGQVDALWALAVTL